MATKYEIFLREGRGYAHVSTQEAGSARQALDMLVKQAEEFTAAATQLGAPETEDLGPPDTSGQYLVVPTSNATFLNRYTDIVYVVEEVDPIHGEPTQQEIS